MATWLPVAGRSIGEGGGAVDEGDVQIRPETAGVKGGSWASNGLQGGKRAKRLVKVRACSKKKVVKICYII
jgi:hypothetical protein